MPYPGGEASRRYYQDAAIRAALERIARGEKRILLFLATGTGKYSRLIYPPKIPFLPIASSPFQTDNGCGWQYWNVG
ncbi:MAG: hypothetical protein E3J63_02580 [Elusimicrobia bacterium]|nr:MAG: hypothetical protein E3J63_02580 [Elusimicrobiota bacterium]